MEIRRINDELSVSPQIMPSDIETVRDLGFRAVICNRPDGEEAGQPGHADIQRSSDDADIEMRFIPVRPGQITEIDVNAFRQALAELPGPVLAYCRTGTRSAILWARSQAGRMPLPEILECTGGAGYDLSQDVGLTASNDRRA